MDKLNQYRQPMITATGIFLGFMLNFTSSWLPEAFTKNLARDLIVAIGTMIGIASLLLVLFRILRMQDSPDPERFYRKTLLLFLIGITIPFLSFLLVVVRKLILNWHQLHGGA